MFDRVTALGLAFIFATLAVAHGPWWLAGIAAVAGIAAYDRWARRRRNAVIANPANGHVLPLADAVAARNPAYVIGDFLAQAGEGRSAALRIAHGQMAEIVRQCARDCRRIGHPCPPAVQVLEALEPFCAGCGQRFSPAWPRQAWRDATLARGPILAPGLSPSAEGTCPRCGGQIFLLVFDP